MGHACPLFHLFCLLWQHTAGDCLLCRPHVLSVRTDATAPGATPAPGGGSVVPAAPAPGKERGGKQGARSTFNFKPSQPTPAPKVVELPDPASNTSAGPPGEVAPEYQLVHRGEVRQAGVAPWRCVPPPGADRPCGSCGCGWGHAGCSCPSGSCCGAAGGLGRSLGRCRARPAAGQLPAGAGPAGTAAGHLQRSCSGTGSSWQAAAGARARTIPPGHRAALRGGATCGFVRLAAVSRAGHGAATRMLLPQQSCPPAHPSASPPCRWMAPRAPPASTPAGSSWRWCCRSSRRRCHPPRSQLLHPQQTPQQAPARSSSSTRRLKRVGRPPWWWSCLHESLTWVGRPPWWRSCLHESLTWVGRPPWWWSCPHESARQAQPQPQSRQPTARAPSRVGAGVQAVMPAAQTRGRGWAQAQHLARPLRERRMQAAHLLQQCWPLRLRRPRRPTSWPGSSCIARQRHRRGLLSLARPLQRPRTAARQIMAAAAAAAAAAGLWVPPAQQLEAAAGPHCGLPPLCWPRACVAA